MKCDKMNLLMFILLIIILVIVFNKFLLKRNEGFFAYDENRYGKSIAQLTDLEAKCYLENNPSIVNEFIKESYPKNKSYDDNMLIGKAKWHWQNRGYKEIGMGDSEKQSPFMCLTDYEAQCYLDNNPGLRKAFGLTAEGKDDPNASVENGANPAWIKNGTHGNKTPLEKAKYHWKAHGSKEVGTDKEKASPFTCATDPNNREKYYVYKIGSCKAGDVENRGWPNRKTFCGSDISKFTEQGFNSRFVKKGNLGSKEYPYEKAQFSEIVGIYGKTGRFIKDDYTIKDREDFKKKSESLTKNDLKEMLSNSETKLKIALTGYEKGKFECVDSNNTKTSCPWD